MAGRRGDALTGTLVTLVVAGALGGAALLADDVVAAVAATGEPVAWTSAAPAPVRAPQAVQKAAPKAVAGTTGFGPTGPGGSGSAGSARTGAVRMQPPHVVTTDAPPSARLVGPGVGGVDRGIGDTGTHSDGTDHARPIPARYHPGSRLTLTATPSPGRVDLAWFHNGDPAVITYRVGYQADVWMPSTTQAASWTTAPIVWADLKPIAAQGVMRWQLPRATRGVEYTFWLEVDLRTLPEDLLGSTRMLLGQTSQILVP